MNFTKIKYDGEKVVLKYADELGDFHTLECQCDRRDFQDLLSRLSNRVSDALPAWQVNVNPKKGTITETVVRQGTMTMDGMKQLIAEAEQFVRARRLQLELFEASEKMNPPGARITKIDVMREGSPA